MIIKYDIEVNNTNINLRIKKIINQIYKLLPMREEGGDWEKPLETILEELQGMGSILDMSDEFFGLVCKLEGLFYLKSQEDFQLYRRSIFECLSLLNLINKNFL